MTTAGAASDENFVKMTAFLFQCPYYSQALFIKWVQCEVHVGNVIHVVLATVESAWPGDYRKTSNISRTLIGNSIVDNSDVVGAAPTGDAPTTSSFST